MNNLDSFLKTANCVELHTMSELDDVRLTFCCSAIITLPTGTTFEKSEAIEREPNCEMLEFDTETAGRGCTQATELNPVAASTQVIFKDTLVELKEQPSIASLVRAALDDSSSRPSEAPLES